VPALAWPYFELGAKGCLEEVVLLPKLATGSPFETSSVNLYPAARVLGSF